VADNFLRCVMSTWKIRVDSCEFVDGKECFIHG
jgi:hypothetical protein